MPQTRGHTGLLKAHGSGEQEARFSRGTGIKHACSQDAPGLRAAWQAWPLPTSLGHRQRCSFPTSGVRKKMPSKRKVKTPFSFQVMNLLCFYTECRGRRWLLGWGKSFRKMETGFRTGWAVSGPRAGLPSLSLCGRGGLEKGRTVRRGRSWSTCHRDSTLPAVFGFLVPRNGLPCLTHQPRFLSAFSLVCDLG